MSNSPSASPMSGPDDTFCASSHPPLEWIDVFNQCFGQLDEGHRRILMLRVGLKLSYEEIAAKLEMRTEAARLAAWQARANLQTLLTRHPANPFAAE